MRAEVAELADAHGSGPCTRKGVGVRVPSSAPAIVPYHSFYCQIEQNKIVDEVFNRVLIAPNIGSLLLKSTKSWMHYKGS